MRSLLKLSDASPMVCISTITRRANNLPRSTALTTRAALQMRAGGCVFGASQAEALAASRATCQATIFLSFDAGSMSQAQFITDTLRQQHVKASFFPPDEKTVRGDNSADSGRSNILACNASGKA